MFAFLMTKLKEFSFFFEKFEGENFFIKFFYFAPNCFYELGQLLQQLILSTIFFKPLHYQYKNLWTGNRVENLIKLYVFCLCALNCAVLLLSLSHISVNSSLYLVENLFYYQRNLLHFFYNNRKSHLNLFHKIAFFKLLFVS